MKMEKTEEKPLEEKPHEEKPLEEKVDDGAEEELEGPCSSPKAIAMTITKVGFHVDTSIIDVPCRSPIG